MKFIEETNAQNLSYKLGENDKTDLSYEEFLDLYTGANHNLEEQFLSMVDHPDYVKFES